MCGGEIFLTICDARCVLRRKRREEWSVSSILKELNYMTNMIIGY